MDSYLADFCAVIDARQPLARQRVLDIGCGDGAFVRELTRARASVTGVESISARLDSCERAPKVGSERYQFGVGQSLPFGDNSFDISLFRASLHHVPVDAIGKALLEARRVTTALGEIFVFEPEPTGAHYELARLVDDDAVVRGEVRDAIERAVASGPIRRLHSATLMIDIEYRDLQALREQLAAGDPARAASFDAVAGEAQRLFESTGSPCRRGRRFTQPYRLDVFSG